MKVFTIATLVFLIFLLAFTVPSIQAQDEPNGMTVTVPDGGGSTLPPVTWNPDDIILIIMVGFVIAFGVLGGVVVFLGNKLYNSAPQWAQPGIENIVRTGATDALRTAQQIVIRTPTPLDDHALQIIEQRLNEMLSKVFRND